MQYFILGEIYLQKCVLQISTFQDEYEIRTNIFNF